MWEFAMQPSTNLAPRDGEPDLAVEHGQETEDRLAPGVRTVMLLVIAMLLSLWGVALTKGSLRLISWLAQLGR
jgi:hypothetical protein